jgi:transposase
MAKRNQRDQKTKELRQTGTFNPHAETVTDPLFQQNPFFDPQDLLQARYEMLRRHTAEQMSVLDAATAFGVSRPTFYQAQEAFQRSGLAGLLPDRRGPKGRHKLTAEVLDYVVSLRESDPKLNTVQCVKAIQQRFAISIHRRSLERALAQRKKKPRYQT